MDNISITQISLVWLVYTFLFIESDKQILDLFNRLKFSLSIFNGVIEKVQLDVKMYLGIPEVVSSAQILGDSSPHKNNILKFKEKISEIENAKKFLIINLFILTFHSFVSILNTSLSFHFHIIISLVFSLCFYLYVQRLPKFDFSVIASKPY